ncbi:MAG: hypothetical protein KAV99_00710 [Candidatus Latescibacteria bacterium]|nr:hypothetical protein [Candidatus Latescibacterota bacterium]
MEMGWLDDIKRKQEEKERTKQVNQEEKEREIRQASRTFEKLEPMVRCLLSDINNTLLSQVAQIETGGCSGDHYRYRSSFYHVLYNGKYVYANRYPSLCLKSRNRFYIHVQMARRKVIAEEVIGSRLGSRWTKSDWKRFLAREIGKTWFVDTGISRRKTIKIEMQRYDKNEFAFIVAIPYRSGGGSARWEDRVSFSDLSESGLKQALRKAIEVDDGLRGYTEPSDR